MSGSLTNQTFEMLSGTIDVIKQTQSLWVNVGSVNFGTVGTLGTSLATLDASINYGNELVLVPRGDQYDNGIAWSEPQVVYQYGSEGVWDTDKGRSACVVGTGTGYFMYQGAKGTAYQIVVMESADGIAWGTGRRAVPFGGEGTWDAQAVRMPSVLIDGGTTWKMWMAAQDVAGTYRIMYSTSADGFAWTVPDRAKDIGSLTAYDYLHVTSPSVIRDGDHFKMLYNAVGGGAAGGSYIVCLATSVDGVTWTRGTQVIEVGTTDNPPYRSVSANYPHLSKDGTIYKTWFMAGYEPVSAGGSWKTQSLWYATSSDCASWASTVLSWAGSIVGAAGAGKKESCVITGETGHKLWIGAYEDGTTFYATSMGTPDNNILMWDIWNDTVLTVVGTSIKFRPSVDAPFVGPAYYFSNFGQGVKVGITNNSAETLLDNVYVDVWAR